MLSIWALVILWYWSTSDSSLTLLMTLSVATLAWFHLSLAQGNLSEDEGPQCEGRPDVVDEVEKHEKAQDPSDECAAVEDVLLLLVFLHYFIGPGFAVDGLHPELSRVQPIAGHKQQHSQGKHDAG